MILRQKLRDQFPIGTKVWLFRRGRAWLGTVTGHGFTTVEVEYRHDDVRMVRKKVWLRSIQKVEAQARW